MKTVVHYIDSNLYGGCEQVVSLLFSRLEAYGWRPVLLYHESPGLSRLLDEARELGVTCRSVAPFATGNRFGTLRQLVGALRFERPNLFHAHLSWTLGCRYGLIAARLGGVPNVVVTSHLVSPLTEELRFRRLKEIVQDSLIDRYIAVSNGVKKSLREVLGVDGQKISVVFNGISVDRFDRAPDMELRDRLVGPTSSLILVPARMHPQKGHRHLLEAAALAPAATFLLAGDGPERQQLEDYSDRLGLGNRVRFLSNRNDIPELMAACDLIVLPSLYEGLPLTVLEAMAAGKPVVATSVGGTEEAVVHGKTGLLVPPADPPALAAAINRMISEPEQAKEYGEAGRDRVRRMFSVASMVDGVVGVYDELCTR